jgi:hypothetical protein
MELLNGTPLNVASTIGLDPDGRERFVVVAKGTFQMPTDGGAVVRAATNHELVFADTFTGEPGRSSMIYECDFAPQKARCDVLLLGTAYAPDGVPVERVPVGLRVGGLFKGFDVVGPRYWSGGVRGLVPTPPQPFTALPLSYDVAYGGSDAVEGDVLPESYGPNPVGRGYYPNAPADLVLGAPLPNTEERGDPVESPRGRYRPMALGPIGRNFDERLRFGGTYDERWLDEVCPFLPADFDLRYYQASPADQQLPFPSGGEVVQLFNLTPRPIPAFELPRLEVPVEVGRVGAARVELKAVLDTLVLEPDRGSMQLVWRASLPLERNIHEITRVIVGRMPRGFYRARSTGKAYYPSLHHLALANAAGGVDEL